MLLHRLVEFASRPETKLPPDYYRPKKIHWVLFLGADGSVDLEPQVQPTKGSKEKPFQPLVPHAYRSGVKPPPYLLVDTAQYVLGVPKTDAAGEVTDKAGEEARRRHVEWAALAMDWARSDPDEPAARALSTCLADGGIAALQLPPEVGAGDNVALITDDGTWLHELPSVQAAWARIVRQRKSGGGLPTLCLVCGEEGELLSTIPESIKAGAIPTSGLGKDAQLVSINTSAQGRGGAIQLVNTPVCERCGSRAMAALNLLLSTVDHRRRTADSVTVWWTREPVDPGVRTLDRPEDAAHLVDSLNKDPGPTTAERVDGNRFHSLTLAVNNARAVLLDWIDVPLREVRDAVIAWHKDHRVHDGWLGEYRYIALWQLAPAAGRWDAKAKRYVPDSSPKGLVTQLLHAALTRGQLPAVLLPHLLQRVRADRHIDAARVALLRLLLNSDRRTEGHRPVEHLAPGHPEIGYQCGRTFAVLESVQHAALHGINTTVGDQYFGTAMTAPGSVLPNLRVRANAHLKRLRRDKPAAFYALSTRLSAAFAELAVREGGIPTLLDSHQQGWFVLGYEHQRDQDNAARAVAKSRKEQAAADAAEEPGEDEIETPPDDDAEA